MPIIIRGGTCPLVHVVCVTLRKLLPRTAVALHYSHFRLYPRGLIKQPVADMSAARVLLTHSSRLTCSDGRSPESPRAAVGLVLSSCPVDRVTQFDRRTYQRKRLNVCARVCYRLCDVTRWIAHRVACTASYFGRWFTCQSLRISLSLKVSTTQFYRMYFCFVYTEFDYAVFYTVPTELNRIMLWCSTSVRTPPPREMICKLRASFWHIDLYVRWKFKMFSCQFSIRLSTSMTFEVSTNFFNEFHCFCNCFVTAKLRNVIFGMRLQVKNTSLQTTA